MGEHDWVTGAYPGKYPGKGVARQHSGHRHQTLDCVRMGEGNLTGFLGHHCQCAAIDPQGVDNAMQGGIDGVVDAFCGQIDEPRGQLGEEPFELD